MEGDNAEYIRGYNKYELIKENNIFTKLKETVYAIDESDSSSTFENKEYRIPSY